MWLRTPAAAVDQLLMAELLAIGATPNRSRSGSESNRSLAGPISLRDSVKLTVRGRIKVGAEYRLHVLAYDLIWITNLLRTQRQQYAMA